MNIKPFNILVQIQTFKCEALNGPNNITLGPITGNWRLTLVDIPSKPSFWLMDIEVSYKESIPRKRTWKERFKKDFWITKEFTEENKTVFIEESLFEINQIYDFSKSKPEPKPKPKPKPELKEPTDNSNEHI